MGNSSSCVSSVTTFWTGIGNAAEIFVLSKGTTTLFPQKALRTGEKLSLSFYVFYIKVACVGRERFDVYIIYGSLSVDIKKCFLLWTRSLGCYFPHQYSHLWPCKSNIVLTSSVRISLTFTTGLGCCLFHSCSCKPTLHIPLFRGLLPGSVCQKKWVPKKYWVPKNYQE